MTLTFSYCRRWDEPAGPPREPLTEPQARAEHAAGRLVTAVAWQQAVHLADVVAAPRTGHYWARFRDASGRVTRAHVLARTGPGKLTERQVVRYPPPAEPADPDQPTGGESGVVVTPGSRRVPEPAFGAWAGLLAALCRCPTACDPDCPADCHEGHQPAHKREHDPADHGA